MNATEQTKRERLEQIFDYVGYALGMVVLTVCSAAVILASQVRA